MKVVVIGGTGLIGSKVVAKLTARGHGVIPASPRRGVDTLTGEGLAEALTGAQVVVEVSNSPSFDDEPVLNFFTISTRNLLAAEQTAGVGHHVALSVVGADRVPDSGYLRAKATQENLIKESATPYSIVRATQFYEFVDSIAASATDGNTVRLPHALMQPIAAEDVATAVTRAAIGRPTNGTAEIAGPETFTCWRARCCSSSKGNRHGSSAPERRSGNPAATSSTTRTATIAPTFPVASSSRWCARPDSRCLNWLTTRS